MKLNSARPAGRPFILSGRQPRLLLAVLLVATLAAGGQGWAAEAEPGPTADASTGTTKPSADADAEPGTDVFIPTEDISEDFAVAFPVDI
ncbi:MAG: hypothetical protein AB7I04_11290 [Pseudomonadales bacterium]